MPNSDVKTTAKDIMSSQLIVVQPQNTFRDAVELLTKHRLTGLPVVSPAGKLLGVITEKEILSHCNSVDRPSPGYLDKAIRYKKSVRTVNTSTTIDEVRRVLGGKSFRHVPVINKEKKLVGIITRRDLI